MTSIGEGAFDDSGLKGALKIPDSVTSIGSYAFRGCENLTSVELPKGLTSIAENVFDGCSRLKSVVLPEGLTSIGDKAFHWCYDLTGELKIPESVTSIGPSAFNFCRVTSVKILSRVTSIESHTFNGCEYLTSIEIPSCVTSIADGAFTYCTALTSMTVLATTPPQMAENVFEYAIDLENVTLYVPIEAVDNYKAADVWKDFGNIVALVNVKFVDWNDNVLKSEMLEVGKDATAPADPERDGYNFTGWSGTYTNVTENVTIRATYEEAIVSAVTEVVSEEADGPWYDLAGKKYDSKPTLKGIYVHNGKKVLVK